jgi:hypothetical protein
VTAGADADLDALKREMGMIPAATAPAAKTRVEETKAEEELSEAEMAELEAALEDLKKREEMAKG